MCRQSFASRIVRSMVHVLLPLLLLSSAGWARDYYVSPSGTGYGNGSRKKPWDFARADKMAKAGDVIHVLPGTYTFYPSLELTAIGLPHARIRWVSEVKGAARIVSSGATDPWDKVVAITGDYVDLEDFDVTATNTTVLNWGITLAGSHQRAIGNTVHGIPATGPVGIGGAGIVSSLANWRNRVWGTDNQAIGNLVYNIGDYRNSRSNPRVHGIYWANRNGYVANNVVYQAMSWGIKFGHAADHGTIVNNLVFSNGYGGIVVGPSTGDNGGTKPDYMYVANNIVYHNGIGHDPKGFGIIEYADPTDLGPHCTYSNNLVYDNQPGNWKLGVTKGNGIDTITAPPKFVNWQADGSGDYRPAPDSPVLGRGIAPPRPDTGTDKDDVAPGARGHSHDIGPYEYREASTAENKEAAKKKMNQSPHQR